jgi:hypothetical protein
VNWNRKCHCIPHIHCMKVHPCSCQLYDLQICGLVALDLTPLVATLWIIELPWAWVPLQFSKRKLENGYNISTWKQWQLELFQQVSSQTPHGSKKKFKIKICIKFQNSKTLLDIFSLIDDLRELKKTFQRKKKKSMI